MNGLCGNDSRQENVNIQLISSDTAPLEQKGCVLGNKSTCISPPWNALGARPKSKSTDMGVQQVESSDHKSVMQLAGRHYHPPQVRYSCG